MDKKAKIMELLSYTNISSAIRIQIESLLSEEKEKPMDNQQERDEKLGISRIKQLEDGIQEVLNDEESQPGAWGPDVTCVGKLRKLIKNK
jgi:hypothetical protein